MRILNRKAFLAMPAGTIFCPGGAFDFDGPRVKGDSLENDYWSRPLNIWDFDDSGEMADRGNAMLDRNASFPLNADEFRDGLFQSEELYLVYERADLEELQRIVAAALDATPTLQEGE